MTESIDLMEKARSLVTNSTKHSVDDFRAVLLESGQTFDEVSAIKGKANLVYEVTKLFSEPEEITEIEPLSGGLFSTQDDTVATAPHGFENFQKEQVEDNWHDTVMGMLTADEFQDGNPKTAGLRRVAKLLLGETIFSGPISLSNVPYSINNEFNYIIIYNYKYRDRLTGEEVSYTDIADANSGNTPSIFAKHLPSTACTRAEGRALRKALGLKASVVAAEELADIKNPQQQAGTTGEWNPEQPINQNQINFIKSRIGLLGADINKLLDGKKLEELSKTEAGLLISKLGQHKTGEADES